MTLIKRGGKYSFVKRIPKVYQHIDPRERVTVALKTGDKKEAQRKAIEVERMLEEKWKAQVLGTGDPERFDMLFQIALRHGFTYKTKEELFEQEGFKSFVDRLDALPVKDKASVDAVTGVEPRPEVRMSQLLDLVTDIKKTDHKDKNPRELRKWSNPRKLAISRFIKVNGDIPINQLERGHGIKFREFLEDLIEDSAIKPETANKNINYINATLSSYLKFHYLTNPEIFKDLKFKGAVGQRLAIPMEWSKEHLTFDNLSSMNDEAAAIILTLINTGCRNSEVIGLEPDEIILDHEYPHINIKPNDNRSLKNTSSARKIVLVGRSLEAMRKFPNGFPRYNKNPDHFSNTANKYLRANGLFPSEDHSIYGLRHGFSDALLKHTKQDRVIADLMGHEIERERYGEGFSLKDQFDLLKNLAV